MEVYELFFVVFIYCGYDGGYDFIVIVYLYIGCFCLGWEFKEFCGYWYDIDVDGYFFRVCVSFCVDNYIFGMFVFGCFFKLVLDYV